MDKLLFAQQVEYLLATVGPKVTATGIGLDSACGLSSWRRGKSEGSLLQRQRVSALVQIVQDITESRSLDAAGSFLRGRPATLGGDTPVVLLGRASEADLSELVQRICHAAAY